MSWSSSVIESGDVHVTPLEDLVTHEDGPDCVCKPRMQIVLSRHGDGLGFGLVFVHSSLDGRELAEANS